MNHVRRQCAWPDAWRRQKKTDIEAAIPDLFQHAATHTLTQLGFQLWRPFHQAVQKRPETDKFRIHDGTNPQPPSKCVMQCPGALRKRRHGSECFFSRRQESLTIGGQHQTLGLAQEQFEFQFVLQLLELEADGGLSQMEASGGAAYTALTGDSNERPKALKGVHKRLVSGSRYKITLYLAFENLNCFPPLPHLTCMVRNYPKLLKGP